MKTIKNENKKELILKNFKESILKDGYSKVSISYLTEKCKISKGSFYTYFSSKDEMLLMVIELYERWLTKLLNDFTEQSTTMYEYIDKCAKYRLEISDEELELELVLINLFKNLESLSNENLSKICNLTSIYRNYFEKNLRKYFTFSDEEISMISKIIMAIRENRMLELTFEINDRVFRIKDISEIRRDLKSEKMIKEREMLIKNIEKILKN